MRVFFLGLCFSEELLLTEPRFPLPPLKKNEAEKIKRLPKIDPFATACLLNARTHARSLPVWETGQVTMTLMGNACKNSRTAASNDECDDDDDDNDNVERRDNRLASSLPVCRRIYK